MDTITAAGTETVVVMSSAQVGKTEIVNNIVGYHIHQDPSPILVVQPTLDMAETWSKDRLAPMLRDAPALRGLVADPRARDSGNTLLHKNFPGGHVTVVGANSAAGLASRPIRVLLADEVDRYPPSAGTEGDALNLAERRTQTFWNRRKVFVSTPTLKGFSRIEREWLKSDQRRYHVPCRHCGSVQQLEWRAVRWPEGEPDQAALFCRDCDDRWSEADRLWAVARGEWIAAEPQNRIAGFHISELYSPWSSIPAMARSFLAAQASQEMRKAWVNTALGEPYEQEAARVDPQLLSSRAEKWDDGAPQGVLCITCGVDVQGDRLEVERVGWGVDEESWSLDYHQIWGDPSDPQTWKALDAYLATPTERLDGRIMHVRATCIDSGGHHTQRVYQYARQRRGNRVHAIKGRAGVNVVWPSNIKRRKPNQTSQATIVGVDAAKDTIFANLQVQQPGPGYCHFPAGRAPAYFDQLTAEVVQTRYSRGFPVRVYVLPEGRRNEALDCRVYAYAALQSLGVRWGVERQLSEPNTEAPVRVAPAARQTAPPARRQSSYLGQRGGKWL